MADITLGDLLHWQLGYAFRAAAGQPPDAGLDQPLSWVVTIRATAPVLPALRGGELVVAPPRLIEQLEAGESFDRQTLVSTLASQPIAALLVDASFSDTALPSVNLLTPAGAFPHDAEATLNRLLTERRAQLYRLGSELTRALTTGGVSGAGIDALLAAADQLGGRQLVALDGSGGVLASSRATGAAAPIDVATLQQVLRAAPAPRLLPGQGGDWLALRLQPARGTDPRHDALLLLGPVADGSHDIDRLVLTQTAQTVELLLGRSAGFQPTQERRGREALVAELLRGALATREAADSRARLLGLDPTQPARVVLASTLRSEQLVQFRAALPLDPRLPAAALDGRHFALIVPADERFDAHWRQLAGALTRARGADATLLLTASEPVAGAAWLAGGVRQARLLTNLVRAGELAGPLLDACDAAGLGAFALLTPFAAGGALEAAGGARLTAFADAYLGVLEEHDARRHSALAPTLAAYLRFGGALADAAAALGIHRNTLAYRLGRVTELTGHALADPQTRFLLQLALAARALVRASADATPV